MRKLRLKKILALMTACSIACTLVSCGSSGNSNTKKSSNKNSSEDSEILEKGTVASINVIKGMENDCYEISLCYYDGTNTNSRSITIADGEAQTELIQTIISDLTSNVSSVGTITDCDGWTAPCYELCLSNEEMSYHLAYRDGVLLGDGYNVYLVSLDLPSYWEKMGELTYTNTFEGSSTLFYVDILSQ